MPLLLFSLIFLLVVFFIAEPLLKGKRRTLPTEKISRLAEEKDRVYSSLRELDVDLQTGKVSQEDYSRIRKEYLNQAVELLKEIDRLPKRKEGVTQSLEKKMDRMVQEERERREGRSSGSSRRQRQK